MPTTEEIIKGIGENVKEFGTRTESVEKTINAAQEIIKGLQDKVVTLEKNYGDQIAALKKVIESQKDMMYTPTCVYKGILPSERHAILAGHYFLATLFDGGPEPMFPMSKKWLDEHGEAVIKAMSTGTGSAGGFMIPTVLSNTILDLVETVYGIFRANCRRWPGAPDKVPTKEGNVRVYSPDDGQTITASEMLLGLKEMQYKNWATLSVWTRQLDERSIAAIGELIVKSIAEALGEKEDECGFIGDGSAEYFGVTGLLNAVGAAGIVTTINADLADIVLEDLLAMVCKLPKKYRRNAKWFGEATTLMYFYAAKDRAGNQMPLNQMNMNDSDLPNLVNKPVVEVPCMPDVSEVTAGTKFLIFGSVSDAAVIAQKSELIVERSTEFGFANHTQAIKSYETKSMKIVHPGTATKVGAYVVMALRA